jgi:hypothetical protein
MENEIIVRPEMSMQPADPTPLSLIAKLIESGSLTTESVAVAKELVALKEHMEDRQAEKDFATSFAAMQSELGAFQATKPVPDRNGNTRYMYLPYEEIMGRIQPILSRYGFSVSFSTEFRDSRIVQTCTLQHQSGYHRDFTAFVRIGGGPPGCTESQADGAAMTYAKRYALCNALNITVEHDTDARPQGGPITQEQVDTLHQMVIDSGSDEKKFLKFAGANTFAEIGSARYQELFDTLKRKMGLR